MSHLLPAEILSGAGESLGIPGLRADAQGCCRLWFEPDLTLEIRHVAAQGRWLLSCTARGHRVVTAESLGLLLRANLLGAGFGGGWAGLDAQGALVLHLPVPASDMTPAALVTAMEALLEHGERWSQRLAQAPASPSGADHGLMAAFAQRI